MTDIRPDLEELPGLVPCPFCGSKDLEPTYACNHWVVCNSCGCEGPDSPTRDEAIAAWNNRTPPIDHSGWVETEPAVERGPYLVDGSIYEGMAASVFPAGGSTMAHCASYEDAVKIADALNATLTPPTERPAELRLEWREGQPPKPWSEEWFIALTTYGDRVVLRVLPEEYTYDFKTADDTYIKAEKIAKWMQFPDSEYIAPERPVTGESGWQPIETAPKDRKVDLWAVYWTSDCEGRGARHVDARWNTDGWYDACGNRLDWIDEDDPDFKEGRKVTHWRPTPGQPRALIKKDRPPA